MNYELRTLIETLNENGIHVIADRSFDKIEFDFSEHDKKVAEEKDKKIAELERDLKECKDEVFAVRKNRDEMMESFRNGIKPYVDLGQMHETIAELRDRHQSDCIEINRLHTALEVMTEKYMKLREVHGL